MVKRMKSWTKRQVLNWFGNRGVALSSRDLRAWKWENGTLFFIIKSNGRNQHISDTEDGMVDITATHAEDGSPILFYELYGSKPIELSPLKPT
jgi:hypothetical protein